MRKVLTLVIMIWFGVTIMLAGCSSLSETPRERKARISRQMRIEWKLVTEDWDRFMLNDHSTRLTPNNM